MDRCGWLFALLLMVFSIHPSFACHELGKSVILDENFKNPESGWSAGDDRVSYGPSGLVFKVRAAALNLNEHYTSDGTDLCATGIWPASGTDEIVIGVVFWAAKDANNLYMAEATSRGTIGVLRQIGGTWQHLLAEGDDKHPGLIRKKPGESNEVEVQISGPKAIVWVNGKKIFELSGQPPSGSGYVGVFAQRDDSSGDPPPPTAAFTKFLIATYP